MQSRAVIATCVFLATVTALATTQAAPASESSTTTSTPPTTSTIPPGYTYYAITGSSYKLHERYATWDDANTTCASEGAHLLVLNDAEEADLVTRIVADVGLWYTWTGLRDNRPGGVMDWRTVLGEPVSDVFSVWGHGHPEDNPQYTCAYFNRYKKRLYNYPCHNTYYFTCETSHSQ